jgi:hypothetical protein
MGITKVPLSGPVFLEDHSVEGLGPAKCRLASLAPPGLKDPPVGDQERARGNEFCSTSKSPLAETRWVWAVRIAAGISIFFIALALRSLAMWLWRANAAVPATAMPAPIALTPIPYLLVLVWLRGKSLRMGLALAASTGAEERSGPSLDC